MKLLVPILGLLLSAVAIERVTTSNDGAPPLRVVLRVDGVEHVFSDGEQRELPVGDKKLRVAVAVAAERRFDAAGVRFDFPREMTFEYEQEDHAETWTLDGDDCTLLLQSFEAGEPDELAKGVLMETLDALEPSSAKPEPVAIRLGDKSFTGLRGRAVFTILEIHIELTVVGFRVGDRSVVLVVQNTTDDGEPSTETDHMFQLLERTFEFTASK
jgi:hypothetical protein